MNAHWQSPRFVRQVFESYLERVGKAQGSMRFLFDGTPIQPTSTPNDIGLDDNDVIDAMAEQTGGAGAIVQS